MPPRHSTMERVVDALSNVNMKGECHGQNQSSICFAPIPPRRFLKRIRPTPSARRVVVLVNCAHLSLDPQGANHTRAPTIGRSPDGLKGLKTLIKLIRKKLDKKQNPNPGLTTSYCVLCYNPRVVSISSGAAPAANSRALETGRRLIGDINSFREVRSSRGGHLALVPIPKFSFSSSGAIVA